MGRRVDVPITPSVLEWAIEESGYTLPEVSSAVAGGEPALTSWLDGTAKPSLTDIKKIARKLHRQVATFLLPERPAPTGLSVRFRHPMGGHERSLNPTERRYLRRARRLQDAHAWLLPELANEEPRLELEAIATAPVDVAEKVRAQLGLSVAQQIEWRSASAAFDAWRAAVERRGVIVVLFPMGQESCRGFSLWHDTAPLIAVNTTWKDEARIFTLFHELGHLLTRSDSVCEISEVATGDLQEPDERWCEGFAAAVLIPAEAIGRLPKVADLNALSRLASQYKVSLRAMAIRLIGVQKATWSLYRSIPSAPDSKREGGGGGGRNRREIREDELGHRGTGIFVEAVRRGIISESVVLDHLDVPFSAFVLGAT